VVRLLLAASTSNGFGCFGSRGGGGALMHLLDLAFVIPLVLASIASAVVLWLGTHWGLFRHLWIVLNLAILSRSSWSPLRGRALSYARSLGISVRSCACAAVSASTRAWPSAWCVSRRCPASLRCRLRTSHKR
jgi:hypothetical protein